MTDNRDWTADIIKICAVVTAAPRWTGALLASEGFNVPEEWLFWWLPVSAGLSAAMAITEGLAFAYVFNAWRVQKDKAADKLLWLAVLSGITFVIVLAPFVAAQVRDVTLKEMLADDLILWSWSVGVAASTIVIVASVGYAQKRRDVATTPKPAKIETATIEPKAPVAATEETPAEAPTKNARFDAALKRIAQKASGEFGQADVQAWVDVKKTGAYQVLSYGLETGMIEQVDRGRYRANGRP